MKTLADVTTMAVGGPFTRFAEPDTLQALRACLANSRERNEAVLPIGGGSNMVGSDAGFDGVGVRYRDTSISVLREDLHEVVLKVGAGTIWDELVAYAVDRGWAGIECMSGIPGHVGAAPIQNIGAYGQELVDVFVALDAIHITTLKDARFTKDQCDFAYRSSRFKTEDRGAYFISSVELRLVPGGAPTVTYRDLLHRTSETPSLKEVRDVVLQVRREKSMVYDVTDPNHRSAGSFFTNPIVTTSDLARIARKVQAALGDVQMPQYPCEGGVKLSAAWLMDHAGRGKGYACNPKTQLSTKHCLALTNRGEASASDLVELAADVQERVYSLFGVRLDPEPVFVGFADTPLPPFYTSHGSPGD